MHHIDNGFAWVFGWPLIILSIGLAAAGITRHRPTWIYIAAFLALPVSAYLAATPRFHGVGLAFPLLIALGGTAVKRGHPLLAGLLLAPFGLLAVWLAWLVLAQVRA